jgi:polysaccharide deacetylase family protein (PEP-CTERM system associated)
LRDATARINTSLPIVDAMSVDLEDYFHVEAFADHISREDWPRFQSRVRRNTERVLELFARYDCRATFFVLGWVAERDPALIREVASAGHEIGCHSYWHRRVNSLTPKEFREDLKQAQAVIEDACGARVQGYRAPTFSIVRESLWALEILAEEGFLYDSSIFPVRHDLYGFPDAPRMPHEINLKNGRTIFEIPMSTMRILGQNFPVGGGGYLRLLPMTYTDRAIEAIHEKEQQSVIVYFHPWEIDSEQPRIPGRWKSRLRHYTGLKRMENRLEELLKHRRFSPMIELISEDGIEPERRFSAAGTS